MPNYRNLMQNYKFLANDTKKHLQFNNFSHFFPKSSNRGWFLRRRVQKKVSLEADFL